VTGGRGRIPVTVPAPAPPAVAAADPDADPVAGNRGAQGLSRPWPTPWPVAVSGYREPHRAPTLPAAPEPVAAPDAGLSGPHVSVPDIRRTPDVPSHGAVGILPAVRPSLRKPVDHARAGSPRHQESIATETVPSPGAACCR
jgi:hypothetical protein